MPPFTHVTSRQERIHEHSTLSGLLEVRKLLNNTAKFLYISTSFIAQPNYFCESILKDLLCFLLALQLAFSAAGI